MRPITTAVLLEPRRRSRTSSHDRTQRAGVVPDDVAGYVSALQAETDVRTRLRRGVDLLPALVHGCHHASVTTVTGGSLRVRAATDRTSRRADELQDELVEGPTLQAVRTGHSVIAHDLCTENRWLGWCAAIVDELAVTAVLSVLLHPALLHPALFHPTSPHTATLNLYSSTVEGLAGVDIALLHLLAAPLADALADVRHTGTSLGPAA